MDLAFFEAFLSDEERTDCDHPEERVWVVPLLLRRDGRQRRLPDTRVVPISIVEGAPTVLECGW
jgi:hypothetical protein